MVRAGAEAGSIAVAVFVIAPLLLKESDAAWIGGLRRTYDPHAGFIPPHVTLVFGLDDAMEARAVTWTRTCARGSAPGTLRYMRVAVTRDYENSAWYLFLMPREIPPGLAELHRRLNSGALADAPEVGLDGHTTLGRFNERVLAEAVARDANNEGIRIEARFDTLRVVRFDGSAVQSSTDITLGGMA